MSTTTAQTKINVDNDRTLQNPADDTISDISFSPQADFMAVGSWDNKVRIYEVNSSGNAEGRALYEHQAPVLSAQWFADGTKVVSGGCDNAVRVYDIASGQSAQIGTHDAPVKDVRIVNISNGSYVASSSWDKTIKYWDVRQPNNQPLATVQLPERAYTMDSQKSLLVCGVAGKQICVVDLNSPQTIYKTIASTLRWQTTSTACYLSGDGFLVGSIEGRCAVMYVDQTEQLSKGYTFRCHRVESSLGGNRSEVKIFAVNKVLFHPTYGTFVTLGGDGSFHIWDKDMKSRLKMSTAAPGPITSGAFNRDGRIFAYSVGYDWQKGYQFNSATQPNMLKIHAVLDDEVKPRKKK